MKRVAALVVCAGVLFFGCHQEPKDALLICDCARAQQPGRRVAPSGSAVPRARVWTLLKFPKRYQGPISVTGFVHYEYEGSRLLETLDEWQTLQERKAAHAPETELRADEVTLEPAGAELASLLHRSHGRRSRVTGTLRYQSGCDARGPVIEVRSVESE